MASPLVTFVFGMGTVIVALGAGFTTSYVLLTSHSPKTSATNRPDLPPPIVEKVEREQDSLVAAGSEPVMAAKGETTGSAGELQKSAESPILEPLPTPLALSTAPPVIVDDPPREAPGMSRKAVRVVRVWDGGRLREVLVDREPEIQPERWKEPASLNVRAEKVSPKSRAIKRHVKKKPRNQGSDALFRIARGTI